ncbi:PAP/OAS1 substrate-binding domain-containing protein [Saccharata proteae CBS 121410]|uniref:polynucleotide adenylyltransferase n=1 Tax=Saccharata proteae CBS 121410 TaxID=1314787 RepID=A0A9P4HTE0_9PEZI|nr:PAP/OAS1 substrate-binding domain-containing protein [Saccharata proteae CBS 121410]
MAKYLDSVAAVEVAKAAMHIEELKQKEEFTIYLEKFCQSALAEVGGFPRIELKCFGSIVSGFATTGSDIDLAVLFADNKGQHIASEAGEVKFKFEIFRALEKALLDKGHGARLLTKTRVPILKFCESPTEELFANLLAERQKWEDLSSDEKYANVEEAQDGEPVLETLATTEDGDSLAPNGQPAKKPSLTPSAPSPTASPLEQKTNAKPNEPAGGLRRPRDHRSEKVWIRERPKGPLDFPKNGVGIQCDLNFDNPLGIYNSKLLHLYSLCDPRVRDMVIFVKAWAKRRKINSAYNGTLCSYGYVLMVLHYLINVARPPVLPDLLRNFDNSTPQKAWPTPKGVKVTWKGTEVNFWADEEFIIQRARENGWTQNRETVGALLRGFFQYYAHQGYNVPNGGFVWKQDAICFTGPYPTLPKSAKGWTAAKTETRQNKQVRLRYLLAIVDPFEQDHNVARTVTHHGIVAIRDEFRRAWDILNMVAGGNMHGDLFAGRDEEGEGESVGVGAGGL